MAVEHPPMGSFSRPESPEVLGTRTCHHCASDRLTRIRMRTPSGVDAVFVACGVCERTAWFAVDGDGVPLGPHEVGDLGA
ncbi:MAG: hypothetical protein FWF02_09010 [Micrococcales bacterium]|nr:hypothetical protein [Micrococcales bacterium]MCL2667828.1 hypothetical protein [Micrococcales bacterium]